MFKNHQLLIFSSIGIIFLSILFLHDLNRTNFKEKIKEKIFFLIVAILLFLFFSLSFSAFYDLLTNLKTRPKLTEKYYYNKFCTKYYDISCDKIKIK